MKLVQFLKSIRPTFARYPLLLTVAFLAATLCYMINVPDSTWSLEINNWLSANGMSTIIACLTGISLVFGMNILSDRIGYRIPLRILAGVLVIIYAYILSQINLEEVVSIRYIIFGIAIITHLWVAIGPFIMDRSKSSFWNYNQALFVSISTTVVFSGIMMLGLMLAVGAISMLFGIKMQNVYTFVASYTGIFGSTLIFLFLVNGGFEALGSERPYPAVLRFLVQYVLIPLLIIYALIFYAYMAKIAIQWELPKGYISYLVIGYSIFGILSYLLVFPLRNSSTYRWVRYFSDLFFYSLIPLVVMLFIAIGTRYMEYGMTENRYIIAALAIWISSVILVMLWTKGRFIYYIPTSLLICTLLSLFVPYGNMFSTSVRSQQNRLVHILNKNGFMQNGKMALSSVTDQSNKELKNIYRYLKQHNTEDFLYNLTGLDTEKERDGLFREFRDKNKLEKNINLYRGKDNVQIHDIAGFDYLLDIQNNYKHLQEYTFHDVQYSRSGTLITISKNNKEIQYDLQPYLATLLNSYENNAAENIYDVKALQWDQQIDNCLLRISLDGARRYRGKIKYRGKIMIKYTD